MVQKSQSPVLSLFFSLYTSVATFLFLVFMIGVRGGFAYGAIMLWIGGLWLLLSRSRSQLSVKDSWILGLFFSYFALHYLVNLYQQDILREYDLPLRFLLAIPVLWLLKKYPVSGSAFWGGLSIGALIGFMAILWQLIQLRRGGSAAPPFIHLGNISMIIGLMCFAGWRWAISRLHYQKWWFALIMLGGISGMAGSVLTGTRGAWLAVPIVLVIYLLDLAYYLRWSAFKVVGFAVTALLLTLIIAYQNPIIKSRFALAVKETQLFFNPTTDLTQKAADTSVGQRWLMWSNAAHMIGLKPWLGWGKKGYLEHKNQRILDGEILPQIAKYTDAHNDYLDALVKRGVIGLTSLLALFLLPLLMFTKVLMRGHLERHGYALSAAVMIIGYAVSGLTCTFMTINMNVMFYSITTLLLWSFSSGNCSDHAYAMRPKVS